MRVMLRGVHLPLTEGLKAYVDKHLVRPFARFYRDEAAELDIQLFETRGPKRGISKECRVTAHLPNARTVHVVERGDDLYTCIGLARDRVVRLVKRELERARRPAGLEAFLDVAGARTL